MAKRINRRTMLAATAIAAAPRAIKPAFAADEPFLIPDSPLGAQITWALGLFTGKPTGLTEDEIKKHFDPSVLSQVSASLVIVSLNQASTQLGPITVVGFTNPPSATTAVIEIQSKSGDHFDLTIVISDSPSSLITILTFRAAPPVASLPVASPAAVAIPDSAAGRAFAWILSLVGGAPLNLTDAEVTQHFSEVFLEAVPAKTLIDSLNQASIGYGPFTVESFTSPPTETTLDAIVVGAKGTRFKVSLSVDADEPHKINGLTINAAPVTDAAASWPAFQNEWSQFATRSAYFVTELREANDAPIAGDNEAIPFAIGSAFKLYVLGGLVLEIEAGNMSWDDKLAIRDDWKSLPSGDLQNQPAGTEFTLRKFAEKMISISDNTAADHLLLHVGRENVLTAMAYMGHANPRLNSPFLTTRELFALKLVADGKDVEEFIKADTLGRVGLLPAVDALSPTLASAITWTAPRYVEQIEWFASCNDLANAMSWLLDRGGTQKLSPLLEILAINPGVPFDDKSWKYVGFKGGSEPGVLTVTWLLRSTSNRTFVVSGALNDTKHAIDESAAIASITKAVNLLAKTA